MTALENILSQEIVQRLGWTLVHFVWQASAVALLLAALMAILRKASANLRYIVACLALALIVLAPIVTIQLVPVSIPGPPVTPPPAPAPVVPPTVQVSELPPVEAPTIVPPAAVETAISPPAVGRSRMQRLSERLEPALPHVVSAWLIGVLALSLWHLGGWTQLQRLRRRMVRPVDEPLRARLDELAAKLGVTRAVQLTESALVQIPTVVGWLRPVILLPASALTGLTTEQLDAILAHELAHIRRHDYFVNMLQIIVETLGFYHPAVWWISHKIRTERENCCDDLAIVATGDRVRYARALTSMEEIRGQNSELVVAATGGNLFSRIRRLVGKDSDEKTFSWIPAVTVILLLVALVVSTTLALAANEEHPAAKAVTDKSENAASAAQNNGTGTKVLIETHAMYVDNEVLKQVGLDSDSWTQYRVNDSGSPSMFVIDSHTRETLLKNVEESEDSSSISRIFLMGAAGREAMIKNNSGLDFKSQELGRFIKIKPELSQDGTSVSVDCELLTRGFNLLDVYTNKKVDQNDVSDPEVVESKTNAENVLLADDHALLILGGKLVSQQDLQNSLPVLRDVPDVSGLPGTTSETKVEENEIILIKASVVPPEQSDDVDSRAAPYTVARMPGYKTNDLLRVFLDLHLEPGQYVEIRDRRQRRFDFKQVDAGDIDRRGGWPAYASYVDFEIRSNFDLNLTTERYTRNSLFEHDRWDATFTGPDTIIGDGQFSPTTLCVSTWKAKLWKSRDYGSIPNLVGVIVKPSNKPQESSAEVEKWPIAGRESAVESVARNQEVVTSPESPHESQRHIRVDCRVLEVYPSMKLDRETIIAAENLLGEQSPTLEQWLGQTADARALSETPRHTITDGRTTRKIVDLLVSRGYMKILMDPTMEVMNGFTGRVESKQKVPVGKAAASSNQSDQFTDVIDYLEVTPHIGRGDRIELLTDGTLHRRISPQNGELPPVFDTFSFSGRVIVESGMSLIMSGLQKTVGRTEDSETPKTQTLSILTPTILDVPERQGRTDEQIKHEAVKNHQKEQESATPSVAVLTKGPIPASKDKTQFQIDCLVLKLYYQDEIDSETIIAAENILGEQVLHRSEIGGKLTPEEWVRNAAGTVSGDVEYGRLISTNLYERWKKGRLDAMVNLLASKGFVQILGKPTAHVLEGQEARVTVDRSYLQITLSMYEGENIHLSTKTDISREFPGRRKGQRGPVTRMTSQSVAVVDPETRLILGGRTYTRNHPPTELLFVLTASAVKDEPPVESPPQFKIHGQLLGARGGPISDAGVVVYLQGDTVAPVAESITSKSMGQFKLGPIPALTEEDYGRRRYLVLAEALGHGPAWRQVHHDAQGIIPMKLRAHESAHVSGVVVTTDSKPVAGAKVWVRAIIPPEATEDPKSRANDLYLRAPLERWSATTKSDGSFRITDVADRARIQLSVSHPDFAGSIVHVKPGKDSVIEVQAAATVTGRVLYGKTGRPAAGVKVQAQGVDHVSVPGGFMNSWAETLTDDQGRYKLESLPGGRYNIWAQAQDLTVVALDSFKVEAGQTREAPDLLLVEGGFITGRVINETTGEPFKPGFASDVAIYGPSRPKSGAAVQISRIREDGTFQIRVAPGRNYIYLRPGDNWRREQAAVTPPSRWVEVGEGQTVEVEFKIRRYSQDELDQRRKRRHIFTYSIPKTVDEVQASHDQTGEKTPMSVEKEYETVQLRYADVEDVAGRVEEASRPMPEMELGEDMLLQPLERARQMIIFGPPDKRGIVKKLIAEIDTPPGPFETRVFRLKYADPNVIKDRIEGSYEHPADERQETVRVVAFPTTRQVTVIASPENMSRIAEQIAEWDVFQVLKPRIIGLQNSDPVQMASLLTTLFTEESGQANIYHVICGDNCEQKQQAERLAGDHMTFEGVPGTKKIIVITNVPEAYDIVGDLILELDEQKMATKDVKQVREWIKHSRRSKKSAEILMRIGRAMLIYANDHDGKYPDTLGGLKEHLRADELTWARGRIEYLGGGKTTADGPDVVTAFDAEMQAEGKGTNVLFNDSHVEFADPDTLKRWNISSNTPVLLNVRILTATDDFLEDIGLDANSVRTSELWSEHLISDSPGDPNSQPYRLILDDLTVNLLLRAVRAAPKGKGVRVVAAPQVVALDGKLATMKVVRAEYTFLGSSDPNDPSARTESRPKTIDVGTSIRITPDVLPGNENVSVDFEWELRQVRGFKEYTGPDKKKQMLPSIAVDAIESTAVVPDGRTLLICGTRFTEYQQSAWSVPLLRDLPGVGGAFRGQTRVKGEPRTLLIMVKAVIDPQFPASSPPPPPDPDDPL